MKLAALCDHDTGIGLRLAGIATIKIPSQDTLLHDFDELTQQQDIGVLFITESLTVALGKTLKEYQLTHEFPIIVEIPDKHGKQPDHIDFISHLVKRAVGIDVTKHHQPS